MLFQTTMLNTEMHTTGDNVTVVYRFRPRENQAYLRKQWPGATRDGIPRFTPPVKRGCMIASPRDAEPLLRNRSTCTSARKR